MRRSTSRRKTIILPGTAFISIPHSRRATRPIWSRDLNFNGTIVGNVHAQPLYIEGGPNGPMVIAVTASNNIYALNATTGAVIWSRTDIGPAVTSGLPCGNINPVGIIGTPVVDLASRSLFFDALIAGSSIKHFIYSLNVDTGATNAGWPVDLNAAASYNGITFVSWTQEDRGALALVNGIVYVPYSGYFGDCGNYHGWVVGVHINNPSNVHGWADNGDWRRNLGTQRRRQRWHQHVRDHREHV